VWPTDLVAAFIIISAPVGDPVPELDPDDWPRMQFILRETAIDLGIVIDNPTNLLVDRKLFDPGVRALRRRWALLGDAPPKEDLNRVPDQVTAAAGVAHWDARFGELFYELKNRPNQVFRLFREVNEAQRATEAWQTLKEVREGKGGTLRGGLKAIRKYIGEENYKAGRMPPFPAPPNP
jgi:hypothetical protein